MLAATLTQIKTMKPPALSLTKKTSGHVLIVDSY